MVLSIKQQLDSLKVRQDQKKQFWTNEQLAKAKYSLLDKSEVAIEVLGRSAKSIYPSLLLFLLKLQHRGYCDFRPFPIIQTSKAWRSIDFHTAKKIGLNYGDLWQKIVFSYENSSRHKVTQIWDMLKIYSSGYQRDTSRLVAYAKKLGVIEEVCGYSFVSAASFSNARGHSKYFIINKAKNAQVISQILNTLTIKIITCTSTCNMYHFNTLYTSSILNSIINTDSILPIVDKFNAELNTSFTSMMEARNASLPDEEKLIYEGKRAWSQLCSLRKDDERVAYLTKRFGGAYEEWDRTACIPNLIYSLNTGKFLDNDLDLHEKLYGQKFADKEERDNFKTLNMLKWFGDGRSIRGIIHYAEKSVENNTSIKKSHLKILNALCEITKAYEHGDWKRFEAESLSYYKEMKQRAEKFLGGTKKWKDDIFIHESNVHIMFVDKLTKLGYDVAQIYDGFYFKKENRPSNKFLNDLYKECVTNYRNTLLENKE